MIEAYKAALILAAYPLGFVLLLGAMEYLTRYRWFRRLLYKTMKLLDIF